MNKVKEFFGNWKLIFVIFLFKILLFYNLVNVDINYWFSEIITFVVFIGIFEVCRHKNSKGRIALFMGIYILITIIMLADALYFNYFSQYVSINQFQQLDSLFVTNDEVDVKSAINIPTSIFLLFDLPFVWYYFKKATSMPNVNIKKIKYQSQIISFCMIAVLLFVGINPTNSNILSSINHIEILSEHINDIFVNINSERVLADTVEKRDKIKNDVLDIIDKNVGKSKSNKYNGIAEGRNLIVVQMESFQNLFINKKYNGNEITPNLNKLIKGESLYFPNYYQSIGKGNTSDAEFTTMNSIYPVIEGESYRLYQDNTYNGLPWLLRDKGYSTSVFHGYKASFWNRENAYVNQGFETFYSEEKLDMTEKVGFGLTDKEMFKQAVAILKEKESKPFFSFMITLTNHTPYALPSDLIDFELLDKDKDTMFGHYIQSVHYTDEAIGVLIEELKKAGLYDNTIIAFYGDHHGLNVEMEDVKESVEDYLGIKYDYDNMCNVPLIINIPNSGISETIDTVGGQVDFLPTIANLMGIEIDNSYIFGEDIINVDEGFVGSVTYLLEGSFYKDGTIYQIGRDGTFEMGRAWDLKGDNKQELDENLRKYYNRAKSLVNASKTLLEYNFIADDIIH